MHIPLQEEFFRGVEVGRETVLQFCFIILSFYIPSTTALTNLEISI